MTRKRDQPYQRQIRTFDTVFSSKEPQEVTQLVPLSSIRLPAQQPRRYFEQQKMAQLVLSVKEHGILEPLLVRPLPDGEYELVAGERRYRAAKEVGLLEVPIVARELTDEEALQLALVENLLREDLNPVEETEGILQLLALKLDLSVQEVIAVLYRMQNEAKGKVTRNVTGSSEQ
ncbi:MAG TPA: ParB/RepB/Spo0J family partition protein, partial [Waterburya sp.]